MLKGLLELEIPSGEDPPAGLLEQSTGDPISLLLPPGFDVGGGDPLTGAVADDDPKIEPYPLSYGSVARALVQGRDPVEISPATDGDRRELTVEAVGFSSEGGNQSP